MRKRRFALFAVILLTLLLLTACAGSEETPVYENPIHFYYCLRESARDADTGSLGVQVYDLVDPNRAVTDVLAVYLQGPSGGELVSPFPHGMVCQEAWMEADGILAVRLSDEYAQLAGVRLTLANACLTLTLCQFEFVEGVRIETAPGMLSAQTQTPFHPSDFLLVDVSVPQMEAGS